MQVAGYFDQEIQSNIYFDQDDSSKYNHLYTYKLVYLVQW